MNNSFGYRYNPNYTPEPHFIPGYGGHLPGALTRFGINYGNTSHEVLRKRPVLAARLAPLRPEKADDKVQEPLDCICQQGLEFHRGGIIADKDEMFIPEHVCPGYTGCLTLKKKGIPVNFCCDKILRSLGCEQDPYEITTDEIEREDPFPGPPTKILDYTQESKRCKDGMWMRFPKDYITRENFRWL